LPTNRLIGVDEVGRGPLAGPVVVCAVMLDYSHPTDGVDDSKKLSENERRRLAKEIKEHHKYNVVVVPVEIIEALNILGATMQGMRKAIEPFEDLVFTGRALVVVDGNIKIPEIPEDRQRAIVKGDAKSACVAAASIVAKVERDNIMVREAARFPGYGFEEHKGYGSPRHIQAIRTAGLCELHRHSFCRKFLA